MESREALERVEAVADPIRWAIFDCLVASGPLSFTEIGRRVKGAKLGMTYHLSQLENVGLIEQIDHKKWAATNETIWFPHDRARDPEWAPVVARLEYAIAERRASQMRSWIEHRLDRENSDWADNALNRDYVLPGLTPSDIEELAERIQAVADEFKARATGRDGERPVIFVTTAHPVVD